jgi:hypothetical protein
MPLRITFSPTPDGPIGIVHADPGDVMDGASGERIRRDVGRLLGELPLVLRCRLGDAILLQGPEALYRYAGPGADVLPILTIEPRPLLQAA